MADMPILPGLMGDAAAAGVAPLTFDDLSEEEVDALVAEASAKGEAVAFAGEETPEEEALEHGMLEAAEEQGEGEEEEEEVDEEAQAEAEAETFATMAAAAVEECAGYLSQLEELEAQAKETEDGDPKQVKKLLKEAEKLQKDIEKAAGEAEKAAGKGKVDKAQAASEEADSLVAEVAGLVEQAKEAAGMGAGAAGDDAAEYESENGAGAPAGPPKPEASPLEVWARRGA